MTAPLGVLAMALSAASCGGETGILVSVTGSPVDELALHVGVLDDQGDYVLDRSKSARGSVRGRNLRANPYELLVREQDQAGEPLSVRVLALAHRRQDGEDRLVGFAVTDPPQRFVRGEVLRRAVSIVNLGDRHSVAENSGCFRVRYGDERLDLVAVDDRDCDGSPAGEDCDDRDPTVWPGAPEICDGKDNDCDGEHAPRDYPCYVRQGETCFAGTRVCLDAEGKGFDGDCQPQGAPVPSIYCDLHDECGMACAAQVEQRGLSCTVEVASKDGGKAICSGALWPLTAPAGAQHCAWEVHQAEGVAAKLRGKDGSGARIEACDGVSLELGGPPPAAGARVLVVFVGRPAAVLELEVAPEVVAACSDQPLACH